MITLLPAKDVRAVATQSTNKQLKCLSANSHRVLAAHYQITSRSCTITECDN